MTDPSLMELRLIFHSIHNVMLAEELLLKAGVPIEMMPVPREISSDCGMCLACHLKNLDKIKVSFEKEPFTSSVMVYKSKTGSKGLDRNYLLLLTLP